MVPLSDIEHVMLLLKIDNYTPNYSLARRPTEGPRGDNMKDIQKQKILRFMQENKKITKFDAFTQIRCTNLPGRIFELREDGYDIATDMVKDYDKEGNYIGKHAEYILRPGRMDAGRV